MSVTNDFGRHSTCNCIWWNIFGYYSARSNNRSITYFYSIHYHDMRAYPYIIPYFYKIFICVAGCFIYLIAR